MSTLYRRSLPLALIVAAALAALLAFQKQEIGSELLEERGIAGRPHTGLTVAPLRAVPLGGSDTVAIADPPPGEREVLFFFNTSCRYCVDGLPAWSSIADSLAGEPHVRVLGVALDSTPRVRSYVAAQDLRFPVVVLLDTVDSRSLRIWRMEGVPVTAVVDHEGRLLFARTGSLASQPEAVGSVLLTARERR